MFTTLNTLIILCEGLRFILSRPRVRSKSSVRLYSSMSIATFSSRVQSVSSRRFSAFSLSLTTPFRRQPTSASRYPSQPSKRSLSPITPLSESFVSAFFVSALRNKSAPASQRPVRSPSCAGVSLRVPVGADFSTPSSRIRLRTLVS